MSIHNDSRLKLTIPINEIESEAIDQIKEALELENLLELAIMPDIHKGYDIPIGGVALLEEYVWPAAVGFDIGCGMCHINTKLSPKDLGLETKKKREYIFNQIYKIIPVGYKSRDLGLEFTEFPNSCNSKELEEKVTNKFKHQLGTLGSGNHFIEIGINSQNEVGLTIHSGSRNPGKTIGEFYMTLAKNSGEEFGNKKFMFHMTSDYGQNYLVDGKWAEQYALENRKTMMKEVLKLFKLDFRDYEKNMINENHNHAVYDYKNDKVLHRKGATPAEKGQLGVIPSNQRDGVFITEGLGNRYYLMSASHGAGRKMSRNKAKKKISIENLETEMKGIVSRIHKDILDEAPEAYKSIQTVLDAQSEIVSVIDHFKPLIVIKG